MSDKEDNVYMAKLAEQAERYDEMVTFMKRVALLDVDLGVEERNLLSVAYKNVVGARRQSWRILLSMEEKKASQGEEGSDGMLPLIVEYRKKIEGELTSTCNELIDLINNHLYQKNPSSNFDSQVFYVKMLGDYYRYMAEYSQSPEKDEYSAQSLKAYKEASDLAREKLLATSPIRLGLALNFSVFYYEIFNKQQQACKLAKAAFDEAMAEVDTVSIEDHKDSTLIMQLLRDNLTLWTKDLPDENNVELEDVEQEAD